MRAMRPADREAVIALLADQDPWKRLGYSEEEWKRIFGPLPQGRETFVIEEEGKIAGVAVLRPKFLLGDYLELLGVAQWAKGKGLGKQLLEHVESVVFSRAKNIFACVSDFNEEARAFYRRHGYDEVGPMPNLLVVGAAEILLRKTAGPARGK
jgi:ribosomal protein S18 acetylase RimI-like enzyme